MTKLSYILQIVAIVMMEGAERAWMIHLELEISGTGPLAILNLQRYLLKILRGRTSKAATSAISKVQLFLDPQNDRLSFDQNNEHPVRIFAKVIAIFKNSKTEILSNNDDLS